MMHQDKKLYWTADSPFCRIVLWAWKESPIAPPEAVPLSWMQLRSEESAAILGLERTVPCLSGQPPLTDSLRILANLCGSSFTSWLLSADGGLYRYSESQLGRLMYSLYDGVSAEHLRDRWKTTLTTLERLLAEVSFTPTLGQIAMHTFLNFCIALQIDWWSDIPDPLKQRLHQLEKSSSFQKLKGIIDSQDRRVYCGFFSTAGVGSRD